MSNLRSKIEQAARYCAEHEMCQEVAVLIDLAVSSRRVRLRVVNLMQGSVLMECLVASGRGRSLKTRLWPQTSDVPDSWLTPVGRCKVAERYEGSFGVSYRLDGLDSTNSNVRSRAIVLHPSEEVPECNYSLLPLWCSRGCVVVSPKSMKQLDEILSAHKDVLLWIYK
ncbi:MAG: murein L,D-transpeptidase catalytic domain family protein [Rikenellaceae bacterium]|nr:murein L,D-transpeptidase catalytic domain family protein [Rikenellaceae bacterium]